MFLTAQSLANACNDRFLNRWNTILRGGFQEPLYVPSTNGKPAEIQFKEDFIKSALHELSHWCLAGKERRKLIDYGYWYSPDGRSPQEQQLFFKAEVKPQAIEMAFAQKCSLDFEVSCDNLNGNNDTDNNHDKEKFEAAVMQQLKLYETQGFPPRAQMLLQLLQEIALGYEAAINQTETVHSP